MEKQKADTTSEWTLRQRLCALPCVTPPYFCVEDINREPPARDPKDGRVVKETGEALGVQSGAGHQHLQVCSEPGNVFDETKEDVRVERSLVGLIYDDHAKNTQTLAVMTQSLERGEQYLRGLTCSSPDRAQ